jgi:hypothetical protein
MASGLNSKRLNKGLCIYKVSIKNSNKYLSKLKKHTSQKYEGVPRMEYDT